ncbi:MAG: tyrosine-type recombinase/integrase [Aliivibrio sp.]|uniref:tyrosine-type recombinase/integrase n=1 Tax=Aliivibrio sp. TaxID=1872443 RepID=UPI001A5F8C57|nr:tyrosine-type recombinase/integrase [Aliivibrio sp.]
MPVIKLNNNFIKNDLTCPDGKTRIEWCCDTIRGLYVEVRHNAQGVGTYYFRYKNAQGKTCTVKIGLTVDVKLADARDKAKLLRTDVSLGRDPKATYQRRKVIPTLTAFFSDTYLPYAKQHKRTWRDDIKMFKLRLKGNFGKLPLHEIKRSSVQAFHTTLREGGLSPATCDHYVKLLRHVLNHAVDCDVIETNQLIRIKLFNADNKKERYLNDTELARLLQVLNKHHNHVVSNIVLFLLSTGARLNEALTATWANIDIATKTWRINADISKSKRMRAIPLNSAALDVLAKMNTQGMYAHVFINTKTGKPYICIKKTWYGIRKTAGLEDLRLHDLRHNYASMMVNSGRSLYEVQHILGHSDPKVTMRYAHLNTETLHDAADAAAQKLALAGNFAESLPTPPKTALRLVASGKN